MATKQAAYQMVEDGGSPQPAVVASVSKVPRVPDEWMEVVKAAAEGRVMPMQKIANATGLVLNDLRKTAAREGWNTPTRVKDKAAKKIDHILSGAVDSLSHHVEDEDADDYGDDESGSGLPEGELNLRQYESTPKKDRPRDCDLLPRVGTHDGDAPKRTEEILRQLERCRGDVRDELMKRSDLHQLMSSEVTQVAMANFMDKVREDPMLAILYAKQFESLNKTARQNFRLDEKTDPTAGARTIVVMSQPGMLPKPAISAVDVEAELVLPEEIPSQNEPTPEGT